MSLAKLILSEPFKARRHVLINTNPFVIGRSEECDLPLDRGSVSKRHARILFDGEQYLVEDLHSKNGILLNGSSVERAQLTNKDVITLGGIDLQFQRIRQEEWKKDLEKNVNKFKSALESTRAINAHSILEPILDQSMEAFMNLTQSERGLLMIEKQGNLDVVRSVNIDSSHLNDEKFQLSLTAIEKAVNEKQSVAISNASDDSYFGNQTSVQELELKTLVCIPILVGGKTIGILYADSHRREQEFTNLDVEVLDYLAANVGIAIENARLNQEIWNVMKKTSDVLEEVQEKAELEKSLQLSVQDTLESLTSLKQKRPLGEKPLASRDG